MQVTNVTLPLVLANDDSEERIQTIVEAHVIPLLGCVTCTFLSFSPLQSVRHARMKSSLGDDLSPLPWVAMVYMAFTYVVYGLISSEWYVFVSSVLCMIPSFFYVVSALRLCTAEQFRVLEQVIYVPGLGLLAIMAYASQKSTEDALFVIGMTGSILNILMYAAPMAAIRKVCRQRSAAAIHLPLTLTSFVNTVLWTTYGLVINEPFLWAPISIGMCFSILQVILKIVYHERCRRKTRAPAWARRWHKRGRHAVVDNTEHTSASHNTCPICLEPMGRSTGRQYIELSCSHVLCAPCSTKCSSSGLQSCPVCRHPHLLDPAELHSRNAAWRREYARWRVGKNRGAVGEISDITSPEAAAQGGGGTAGMSRLNQALDLAETKKAEKAEEAGDENAKKKAPCFSGRLMPVTAESAICADCEDDAPDAGKTGQGNVEC